MREGVRCHLRIGASSVRGWGVTCKATASMNGSSTLASDAGSWRISSIKQACGCGGCVHSKKRLSLQPNTTLSSTFRYAKFILCTHTPHVCALAHALIGMLSSACVHTPHVCALKRVLMLTLKRPHACRRHEQVLVQPRHHLPPRPYQLPPSYQQVGLN